MLGETLSVSTSRTDQYGRQIVSILREDGLSVNEAMVADGHALAYPYGEDKERFNQLQSRAKSKRLGLWSSGSNALTPWEYRHQHTS